MILGFIVTNPNCSTAGLVLVLKPLADAFGLEKIFVVTMQAVSGAGYPGVPSLDILGNVVPFISGEEEKMEAEPQKLLGKWDGARFIGAGLGISAHCNRVPVIDGHMECVSLRLKKTATLDEVAEALRNFEVAPELAALPTAVKHPVVVSESGRSPAAAQGCERRPWHGRCGWSRAGMSAARRKADAAFSQFVAWRSWSGFAQCGITGGSGLFKIAQSCGHANRRARVAIAEFLTRDIRASRNN